MASSLPPLPSARRLTPAILTLLGQNPGPFTLQGTNVYLVGTGASRLLVDTADGNAEFVALLRRVLSEEACSVSDIILTHHHADHSGGVQAVFDVLGGPVPVWKLPHTEELDFDVYPACLPDLDGRVFHTAGASLVAFATPGHTSDSVSLLCPDDGTVLVGDCVLGTGSGVFTDLHAYMRSLHTILGKAPRRLLCGHGPPVGDGFGSGGPDAAVDKVKQYIAHRVEREAQVVGAFKELGRASAAEVAHKLYAPEGVSDKLMAAAARVTLLAARKLHQDGVVAPDPVADTDVTDTHTVWVLASPAADL